MQTTPPQSPIKGSFSNLPGTPPRRLFMADEVSSSSPLKKMKIDYQPPEAPKKSRKNGPIKGMSVLDEGEDCFQIEEELGKGSFGTVYSIKLKSQIGTPNSPLFALKKIIPVYGGRITSKDLVREANNFGSPGCVLGVGVTTKDGIYLGFSPIAQPLSKIKLDEENIQKIIELTCCAVMEAPKEVMFDASPENMGFFPAETQTVFLGENGLMCVGSPIQKDIVSFIDIGECEAPEDANPKYSALISAETDEDIMKYRRFKCDILKALLENRILESSSSPSKDEYQIVAEICELYNYQYASSQKGFMNF
jgi:serine/threonine protein kinase